VTPLDTPPAPSAAKFRLGQALMFDRELSGSRDVSCATCHLPTQHSSDGLSDSIGTGGSGLGPQRQLGKAPKFVARNAIDIYNRGSGAWTEIFWDSRVSGSVAAGFKTPAGAQLPPGFDNILAVQAMFPVNGTDEMRGLPGDVDVFGKPNDLALFGANDFVGLWKALMDRLLAFPEYRQMFHDAYPDVPADQLGFQHAANAIAAFEITAFTQLSSPFDRYLGGDDSALSPDAKQGALLFYGKARCSECHSGPLMTDQLPHNIGCPQVGAGKDPNAPMDFGFGRVSGVDADRCKFRTPPLRNVDETGPYMHDGAYVTLEAAVRHHLDPRGALLNYDGSLLTAPMQALIQTRPDEIAQILGNLDPKVGDGVTLSDTELAQLMAFLHALTDNTVDERQFVPARVPSGLPIDF
jgi:cytochrome c peroxidase